MSKRWGQVGDGAAFLEALHRADLETDAWLEGALAAFASLVPGAGSRLSGIVRWQPGKPGLRLEHIHGTHAEQAERAQATSHLASERFVASHLHAPGRVTVLRELLGPGIGEPALETLMGEFGVADFLTLRCEVLEADAGAGVMVSAMSGSPIHLSRGARQTFEAFAAHLGAAFRLRRSGLAAATEGVLAPNGRVLHAEGRLRDPEAQDALRHAVVAIERARRHERRTDSEALLAAWRAIYEGRWTLVESIERDGRRMLLARVNPPAQHLDVSLTAREREVAALVGQGVPQKAIGYELELSPSTVAFHVRNIAKKLGATGTTDLVRVLASAFARPTSS